MAIPDREGLVKQSRTQPEDVRMEGSALPPRRKSNQRQGEQALEPNNSASQKRRARRRRAISGRKSEQSQSPAKFNATDEIERIENVLQTIKGHVEELKRQRELRSTQRFRDEAMRNGDSRPVGRSGRERLRSHNY